VKELKERGKMYSYYKIEKNQIRESSEEDYNWLVVKHGNEEEKKSC
jgi:magnesium transporter